MAAAVSASTSAAARPARRMRSMTSAALHRRLRPADGLRPTRRRAGGRSTPGTGRVGLSRPGRMRSVAALWQRLNFWPLPHQQGSLALRTPWAAGVGVTVTGPGYRPFRRHHGPRDRPAAARAVAAGAPWRRSSSSRCRMALVRARCARPAGDPAASATVLLVHVRADGGRGLGRVRGRGRADLLARVHRRRPASCCSTTSCRAPGRARPATPLALGPPPRRGARAPDGPGRPGAGRARRPAPRRRPVAGRRGWAPPRTRCRPAPRWASTPTVDDLLAEADAALAAGAARLRVKVAPGRGGRAAGARSGPTSGDDVLLQADANGTFSLDDPAHLRRARAARRGRAGLPRAAARARRPRRATPAWPSGSPRPICLDEPLTSLGALEAAVALGACEVVCLKPARVGGWIAARRGARPLRRARRPAVGRRDARDGRRPGGQRWPSPRCPGMALPPDLDPRPRYDPDLAGGTPHLGDGVVPVPAGSGHGRGARSRAPRRARHRRSTGLPATTVTLDDVRAAAERIAGAVERTPSARSHTLGEVLGVDLVLKFENLQFTASFKERGALNKLLTLTDDERACGVVAMSAGNHAQAVARHATRLGIDATIVMPATTPFVKVHRTEVLGARIVLLGDGLAEATAEAGGSPRPRAACSSTPTTTRRRGRPGHGGPRAAGGPPGPRGARRADGRRRAAGRDGGRGQGAAPRPAARRRAERALAVDGGGLQRRRGRHRRPAAGRPDHRGGHRRARWPARLTTATHLRAGRRPRHRAGRVDRGRRSTCSSRSRRSWWRAPAPPGWRPCSSTRRPRREPAGGRGALRRQHRSAPAGVGGDARAGAVGSAGPAADPGDRRARAASASSPPSSDGPAPTSSSWPTTACSSTCRPGPPSSRWSSRRSTTTTSTGCWPRSAEAGFRAQRGRGEPRPPLRATPAACCGGGRSRHR